MNSLLYETNLKTISEIEQRPLIIFDIGCNIEQKELVDFTEECLIYCPESRIIGIEPIYWQMYEKKYNSDHRVCLIKAALSSLPGVRTFYKSSSSPGLSSFVERPLFKNKEYCVEETIVNCTTVDEICEKANLPIIDYLKIDTEGAELDILKGSINALKEQKINYIQFEFGACGIEAGYNFNDVCDFLANFGYVVVRRVLDDYLAVSPKMR